MKKYLKYISTVLLLLILINAIRSVNNLTANSNRLQIANEDLEAVKKQNLNLKQQLDHVKTDSFIEKTAIENLNLLKPNEKILILPFSIYDAEEKDVKNNTEINYSNLEKWVKYLNLEYLYYRIEGKYLWNKGI